ncbi:MAG: YbjN domain-containing protein [Tetrasphaera sp.]|jgi:hypothetical protein|nr:YbjN domain-containing protein [Tetrasphaera sp.]
MTDPTALPNLPGFGAPAPTPDSEAEPTEPLRDRALAAVQALGLEASIDQDGDVTFMVQDQQIFIRCSDDDAEIVRVFGQWRLAPPVPEGRLERLEVCNDLNSAFNVIKAAIADDTVLITSEHMIPRGADLQSLFSVAIPLVLHAVGLWHQRAIGEDAVAQMAAQAQAAGQAGEQLGGQTAGGPGPGSAFGLNGNQAGS